MGATLKTTGEGKVGWLSVGCWECVCVSHTAALGLECFTVCKEKETLNGLFNVIQ